MAGRRESIEPFTLIADLDAEFWPCVVRELGLGYATC